jgi:hypothetical protein
MPGIHLSGFLSNAQIGTRKPQFFPLIHEGARAALGSQLKLHYLEYVLDVLSFFYKLTRRRILFLMYLLASRPDGVQAGCSGSFLDGFPKHVVSLNATRPA